MAVVSMVILLRRLMTKERKWNNRKVESGNLVGNVTCVNEHGVFGVLKSWSILFMSP